MTIKIYRSTTAGNVPASLADGQLAINEADEILFYKNSAGAIVSLPMKALIAALSAVRATALGGTGVNASSASDLLSKLGAQPALGFSPENAANKGAANGYAQLGSDGKLPTSIIPSALLTALEFAGTWNASTNTPALTSSAGAKGTIYVVATAGSTTLDGLSQWNVGDWAIFDGTAWRKLDGLASEVLSVAGLVGAITAAALKAALAIGVSDVAGLATVASTGAYADLTGKPVSSSMTFNPAITSAGTVQTAANNYYTVSRSVGAVTFNPPASPNLGDLVVISVTGAGSNVPRFAATVLSLNGGTDTFYDFGVNGIAYFRFNGSYWDWN